MTHGNAFHYAVALADRLGFSASCPPCFAHMTTLAADLGHTSWLAALATGGCVHVVDEDTARNPRGIWAALEASKVSCIKTAPSHLTALLEGRTRGRGAAAHADPRRRDPHSIPRHAAAHRADHAAAGEPLWPHGDHRRRNVYRPSELRDLPTDESSVPIGTAIGDATVRLVQDNGDEIDGANTGELYIGGSGVSRGYFDRPDESALAFPMHQGERVYRTGDICRLRPDGNLVFLGRRDQQVKVSGYRVDLAGGGARPHCLPRGECRSGHREIDK